MMVKKTEDVLKSVLITDMTYFLHRNLKKDRSAWMLKIIEPEARRLPRHSVQDNKPKPQSSLMLLRNRKPGANKPKPHFLRQKFGLSDLFYKFDLGYDAYPASLCPGHIRPHHPSASFLEIGKTMENENWGKEHLRRMSTVFQIHHH